MTIFASFLRWFRGPVADRETQRQAAALDEQNVQARMWQANSPSWASMGIVTPDRTKPLE